MKYDVFPLPEAYQQVLDETPEPKKVQVTLLDEDDLPLARGNAILPLLLGVGVFWPVAPLPQGNDLLSAKCLRLRNGEILKVKELSLCVTEPLHYDFWVTAP